MPKISIHLIEEDWRALKVLSESECRNMSDQLRVMIRREAAARGIWKGRRPQVPAPLASRKVEGGDQGAG